MTLQEIRNIKDLEGLKSAIYFLSDNMKGMTFGEVNAYRSLIVSKSKELNIDLGLVNSIAEEYQVFGYKLD